MTLIAASGILDVQEHILADAWYQERSASGGEIVLVEINQQALDTIGPFADWGREVMAMTLETLNQSEECRPAVIGIDVLYAGNREPAGDAWLAEAAGMYGNVVTASAAEFGSGLEELDGNSYLEPFSVQAYDEPYPALKEATVQGHINAMFDEDGVLRHGLWEVRLPDGRTVPSFAAQAVRLYCRDQGILELTSPPTDSRGFWYVPFTGKPGDYSQSIAVSDVLTGTVPPDYFDGKIVLIGAYAAGLQDSYVTAADHAMPMYGVEYQANMIEALLNGQYKTELGAQPQLALLFAALACCMVLFWKRRLWVATVSFLGIEAGYLLLTKWMYGQGVVLNVLWIPLGVGVCYVGCIAAHYFRSVLEKRLVTQTFRRYVAPEIVDEVLKKEEHGRLEVGGQVMDIAVLFVDIRGFTSMSEGLEPTVVVEILNRYLTLISDCIISNSGTLDKFIGDAAMAFWGAPVPQEDHVMHAVRAAADMKRGMGLLTRELMAQYGRQVSFGIGIHAGKAVVGNIGSPDRMDYTAIGDTVNTASRLESSAPGGTIYLSRAVADRLEGRIRATSLGEVRLKGKTEGVEVLVLEEILEIDGLTE